MIMNNLPDIYNLGEFIYLAPEWPSMLYQCICPSSTPQNNNQSM